jgi:hypothetical protein
LRPMWFGSKKTDYTLVLRHRDTSGAVGHSMPMPGAGFALRVYDVMTNDLSMPYGEYQLVLTPTDYARNYEILNFA